MYNSFDYLEEKCPRGRDRIDPFWQAVFDGFFYLAALGVLACVVWASLRP